MARLQRLPLDVDDEDDLGRRGVVNSDGAGRVGDGPHTHQPKSLNNYRLKL
ncbi:hypothetical protein HanIR_Chr09g0396221 [Helianthus annuus]|nr:hypothetical protein HanIR_Chr09g0396221 [Helianthus annuus]